jgi:hypothetical protein
MLIGLGLMLLALRLVTASTEVLTQSPAVKALLTSVGSDLLLEITLGAVLAVISYSSLAVVLLTPRWRPPAACRWTWRWAWCWAPTWAAACWRC